MSQKKRRWLIAISFFVAVALLGFKNQGETLKATQREKKCFRT
ncbi:MAG: hypothetical protein WCG81_04575 [Candidatus Angelobacter sp.]